MKYARGVQDNVTIVIYSKLKAMRKRLEHKSQNESLTRTGSIDMVMNMIVNIAL